MKKRRKIEAGSLSGLSGDSLDKADNEAIEREQAKSRYNVWTGGAMRTSSLRFSTFVIFMGLYFLLLLLKSNSHIYTMHNAVQRVYLGNLRSPRVLSTLLYTLLHILYDKNEMALANPLEPAVQCAREWYEEGMELIGEAEETFFATVFGEPELDLYGRVHDPRQDHLVFGNICEIEPETMYKLYNDSRAVKHLFPQCTQVQNGINTRGLYASFMFLHEHYKILLNPSNSKAFGHVLDGTSPKFDAETTQRLKLSLDVVYQFYNDFMNHHLVYSGSIYRQIALEEIDKFTDFRIALIAVCASFVAFSYFALIRPTTVLLARSCHQANSMMTLLPSGVIRHVPAVQSFIEDNLSSE